MDPSGVNSIWGLAAVCVMVLGSFFGGIIVNQRTSKSAPTSAPAEAQPQPVTQQSEQPANSNGKVTKEWVQLVVNDRVGQHEIHCSQAKAISQRLDKQDDKLDEILRELREGR